MDFSTIPWVSLTASLMVAATPILLAALGELVVEKSGVLNLGVEGMMITGAITGFMAAIATQSPTIGFVAGALGGAGLSFLFVVLTQYFLANQVASGLALTLFGLGLSAMLGASYTGLKPPSILRPDLGPLSDIPVLGPILFRHDLALYFGLVLVIFVWLFLNFSRTGRVLRAVGENHTAAHALGYKVRRIRVVAILFGGACAGLGGAYLSLIRVPQWTEGMTAGAGWIALAIVVFASWRPGRVVLGAYLFGGITILQIHLQATNVNIPAAYLSMLPFIATILVLVIMSANRSGRDTAAPADLGRIFHASE